MATWFANAVRLSVANSRSEAVRLGSAKAARAEEGRVWKVAQQHVREALDSELLHTVSALNHLALPVCQLTYLLLPASQVRTLRSCHASSASGALPSIATTSTPAGVQFAGIASSSPAERRT